jgi:hypothetical protein
MKITSELADFGHAFNIIDDEQIAEDAYLLATADLLQTAIRYFDISLERELDAIILDDDAIEKLDEGIFQKKFSSKQSAIDLLCQPLAQDVIHILWKNSRFVSLEGKKLAGLETETGLCEQAVSKGEIVNIVCKSLGIVTPTKIKSIDRRIDRYLAAMNVLGLVEIVPVRCNLSEVTVTSLLNHVFRACLAEVGDLFKAQLLGEEDHAV